MSDDDDSDETDLPEPPRTPRRRIQDRYIPSRNNDLQAVYSVAPGPASETGPGPSDQGPISPNQANHIDRQRLDDANDMFSDVLRQELFGTSSIAGTSGSGGSWSGDKRRIQSAPTTPRRNNRVVNMFKYDSSPSRKSVVGGNGLGANGGTSSGGINSGDDFQRDGYTRSPVRPASHRLLLSPRKPQRHISRFPLRVLDAPELLDDFYLNLLDWSSRDFLAVALGSTVYIWDAANQASEALCTIAEQDDTSTASVCSVAWVGQGTHLAVGTSSGQVLIYDVERKRKVRTMAQGHTARASSLSWNGYILSSGSRDRTIAHRDVRVAEHYFAKVSGHRQEVCGLRWNTVENKLASGSNDNKVCVWDGTQLVDTATPLHKFSHTAAVKALAWSPHQRGLLATGGGSADKRLRFWDAGGTGKLINEIDTGSQVCNVAWSAYSNELVSTHGYSRNQVAVWRYPSLRQEAVLTGHSFRVLHLAVSPDGKTVVTGSGDQTLRFWSVFSGEKQGKEGVLDLYTLR